LNLFICRSLVIKNDIISNSNRGGSVDTWEKIPVLKGVKVGKLSSQQYSDLHRKYLNRLYPEAKKTNIISANYTKDDNSLKIEWSFGKLVLNKEDVKLLLNEIKSSNPELLINEIKNSNPELLIKELKISNPALLLKELKISNPVLFKELKKPQWVFNFEAIQKSNPNVFDGLKPLKELKISNPELFNLNLTEVINLRSVFLRKTHGIGTEFFRKMKISKTNGHRIEITSVKKRQDHTAHLFIVIFMLLSNFGFKELKKPQWVFNFEAIQKSNPKVFDGLKPLSIK